MPNAPLKPCAHAGCSELVVAGCCPAHSREREQRRGSAYARGYDRRWATYRVWFLGRYPFCGDAPPSAREPNDSLCRAEGRVTLATVVDHIEPHRGDPVKFWDPDNHRAMCKTCHDIKTASGR